MTATVFRHKGLFDSTTRQNRALRFLEHCNPATSWSQSPPKFTPSHFAPSFLLFDTNNTPHSSLSGLGVLSSRLFKPFESVTYTPLSFQVVDESEDDGQLAYFTVNAEFMAKHWLLGDPAPIEVPRLFICTISNAEAEGQGWDGLQFSMIRLCWDTKQIADEANKRAEKLYMDFEARKI